MIPTSQAVIEQIQRYETGMIDGLSALVAIASENPPGNLYRECAEELLRQLQALGLPAEVLRLDATDDQAVAIRSVFGGGGPLVYFHGHYDVVPAFQPDQFTPSIRNGHLFGRGSADMKGGLICMMYALRALKDLGAQLPGRIALMFVPDEETGGRRGTARLAQHQQLEADALAMFTAEPTSGVIWNACRGAISMRITVRGKSAHVGHHYQGRNAFEDAIRICHDLQSLHHEVQARTTSYRISPEVARNSILLIGGEVRAGTNFNVVPAECSFTIDRRLNPEENLAEEKQRLLALLEKHRQAGVDVQYEIFQEAQAAGVPETSHAARTLARNIELVTGKAPLFEMCPGLLEIRFYSQFGIPALAYGPGLLSVSHGPHECVSVKKLLECAAIYALSAMDLLARPAH